MYVCVLRREGIRQQINDEQKLFFKLISSIKHRNVHTIKKKKCLSTYVNSMNTLLAGALIVTCPKCEYRPSPVFIPIKQHSISAKIYLGISHQHPHYEYYMGHWFYTPKLSQDYSESEWIVISSWITLSNDNNNNSKIVY